MGTIYYDIIFEQPFGPTQTAMFTDKAKADAFIKKLENLGFTVSVETIEM